jgi:hypothetical protein
MHMTGDTHARSRAAYTAMKEACQSRKCLFASRLAQWAGGLHDMIWVRRLPFPRVHGVLQPGGAPAEAPRGRKAAWSSVLAEVDVLLPQAQAFHQPHSVAVEKGQEEMG